MKDSQINDRGDHMSTPLPLAGELADDLLYAPMRSAHIRSGARTPARAARRVPLGLGADPQTEYRFSGSARVICPTLMLLRWIAEREDRAA
jgi:hypothetical protein